MSEAALWKYLRDKIISQKVHATRIESRVSPGFPDVHYTYDGFSGTLELKFLRKASLPFSDQGLNREQLVWHRDAEEAKAIHLIVAEVKGTIHVIPGKFYDKFNAATNLLPLATLVIVKGHLELEDRDLFSHMMKMRIP